MSLLLVGFFLSAVFTEGNILKLTSDNYEKVVGGGHTFVKYFSPGCPHCRNVAPVYQTLAGDFQKHTDKITFAEVDCTEEGKICEKADIRGYPTFLYYGKSEQDKTEYDGDRSLDSFSEFAAGKIGVFYRPKPSYVKILNPDNFESIVMDPKMNVLVAFTAPWCGHCKNLKPHLETAAASFKPSDNVTIANIDGEEYADFVEPYEVHGFPTIKFFPAYAPGDEEKVVLEKAEAEKKKAEKEARKAEYEAKKLAAIEAAKKATEENSTEPVPPLPEEPKEEEQYVPLKKGVQLIEKFDGGRDAAGIINWINARTGTFRALGGGIDEEAGIVTSVFEPLLRYSHAVTGTPLPAEEPTEPIQEEKKEEEKQEPKTVPPPSVDVAKAVLLEAVKSDVKNPYVASQYIRYADAFASKGSEFMQKEKQRLENMLKDGHFTDEKKSELVIRKNILSLFLVI